MKTYIKLFGLLLAFGMLTQSCENVSVNENPNGVIVDELLPEVVMPGAQVRPSALLMSRMNQLGNTMIATWSGNAQQIQAPYFVEFSQQVTADFYSDIWDNLYIRTGNLSNIIDYEGETNYDYYQAAAKILKSFYFQYLVDTYGDIPYAEAHKRGANLFPRYDAQADVYRALVDQIDSAISQIDNTDMSTVVNMGGNDVMLNGNMDLWKRFGNTVKLRLLVRLMNLADQDGATQSYLQQEFASLNSGAGFIGLGEDITINPGYTDENGKSNPFAATYGYNPGEFGQTGSELFGNTATGPTTFLVELLNGTSNGVSDARLSRLYEVRGGQTAIQGNTQGGEGQPSKIGQGLLSSAVQDGYIMTAAESLFLQAEATHRGYLTGGASAKSLFQDGITASFNRLGANLGTYLTDSDNVNGIGWDGTADKVEAIITQKWIALGGTNGLETWIEFNRTGYPSNMPLPDIASQATQPKRMLYPTSEYVGNTANVSEFGQTNISAFNTSIFWDVN